MIATARHQIITFHSRAANMLPSPAMFEWSRMRRPAPCHRQRTTRAHAYEPHTYALHTESCFHVLNSEPKTMEHRLNPSCARRCSSKLPSERPSCPQWVASIDRDPVEKARFGDPRTHPNVMSYHTCLEKTIQSPPPLCRPLTGRRDAALRCDARARLPRAMRGRRP